MNKRDAKVCQSAVIPFRCNFAIKFRLIVVFAKRSHFFQFFLRPYFQVPNPQIIFIIGKQFIEARLSHIEEFDFSLP